MPGDSQRRALTVRLRPEQRRDPDAALAAPLVLLVGPVALHVHHLVFATALQETREYSARLYRER